MSRPKIKIPKDKLRNLYLKKKLSMERIGKMFNTDSVVIHGRLHEYGIPARSISEALKGRIPWNKGKNLSAKTKRKIGKISKERWKNPEFIKKMGIRNKKLSERMKGDKNPMKNAEARKKRSEKMKGMLIGDRNPARKLKVRRKIREALKEHAVSSETRKKISKTLNGRYTGKDNPFYGKHHTKEIREKSRLRAIKQLASGEFNNKPTSIENKIEKELIKRNVYFKKQFPLFNITVADFYLPKFKVAIYADGVFWHKSDWAKKQGIIKKDRKQNKFLTINGYKVFRFSEFDICKSASGCVDKIENYINKY